MRTAENGWTYTDDLWYEYWGKSDTQLRLIINNAATVLLTGNPGYEEQRDAKMQTAAASEVIKARKTHKENLEGELKKLEGIRQDCYLKMKAGYTPNAQLIAAILEDEDGKTAEELHGWCDELAEIDVEEFNKLLMDMVLDGVIKMEGKQYYLERICEKDLLFSDDDRFMDWVVKKCRSYQIQQDSSREKYWKKGQPLYAKYRRLASYIYRESKKNQFVFFPEDLCESIVRHNKYIKEYEDIEDECPYEIQLTGLTGFENYMLPQMIEAGVLKKTDNNVFRVKLLGED